MNKFFTNLSRILFVILIGFELLNELGILNFTLTFTWLGLIVTAAAVWIGLELFSFYSGRDCPPSSLKTGFGLAMLLAVALVYFDAMGDIFLFYAKLGWYDRLGHFMGGAIVAIIFFSVIRNLFACRRLYLSPLATGFFITASATFLGVLYELEEYFEDMLTGSSRLGDALDTANDLFLDLTGAAIIALITSLYVYRKSRSAN
ncbi:MAG: DUF2238 domain-containing protein [Candidatus Portnoybacteria bacterium]|nr:DUF2238 domain-containing protein [Candidatus Portnoybacteria bacterium]